MIEIRLTNGKTIRVDYIVEYMSIDGRDLSLAYRYSSRIAGDIVTMYRVVSHDSYGAIWERQIPTI